MSSEASAFVAGRAPNLTQQAVLLGLARWARPDGRGWVSVAQLASDLSAARSTVQGALRALEKANLIEREEDPAAYGKQAYTFVIVGMGLTRPSPGRGGPVSRAGTRPSPGRGGPVSRARRPDETGSETGMRGGSPPRPEAGGSPHTFTGSCCPLPLQNRVHRV